MTQTPPASAASLRGGAGYARPDLRPLVVHVVAGLLLGVLIGMLAGSTRPSVTSAHTVLSIQPLQPLASVSAGPSAQDATGFIQGELILLTGQDLRGRVQTALGLAQAPVTSATQIGGTYAVDVTATAPNSADAVRIVKAVADTYTADRRARLNDEVTRALLLVGQLTDSVRAALDVPSLQPRSDGAVSPAALGLQTELGRLLSVNSNLTLSRAQLDRAVTVLQTPGEIGHGRLSTSTRYSLGFGLLGALAGVGVLLLKRRTRPRVHDASDLAGLGVPLLLPPLSAAAGDDLAARAGTVAPTARLLAARLVESPGSGPLVLFGGTGNVDAGVPAAAIALQLAERGPVLLVQLAGVLEERQGPTAQVAGLLDLPPGRLDPDVLLDAASTDVLPGVLVLTPGLGPGGAPQLRRLISRGLLDALRATGVTVVVEAPALDVSTVLLDVAADGAHTAVVVRQHTSTRQDVVAVAEILAVHGVALAGIVLLREPQRPLTAAFRRSARNVGTPEGFGLVPAVTPAGPPSAEPALFPGASAAVGVVPGTGAPVDTR